MTGSVDYEAQVAGAIVMEPGRAVPVAWAWCDADTFQDERCRLIYKAAVAFWDASGGALVPRATEAWLCYLEAVAGPEAVLYALRDGSPCPGEALEKCCRALVLERRLPQLHAEALAFARWIPEQTEAEQQLALACGLVDLGQRMIEALRVAPRMTEHERDRVPVF